jgi:hypothetical protein
MEAAGDHEEGRATTAGHEAWHSALLPHGLGHAPPAPEVVLVVLVVALAVVLALAVVPAGAPPVPVPPPLVTMGSQPQRARHAATKLRPGKARTSRDAIASDPPQEERSSLARRGAIDPIARARHKRADDRPPAHPGDPHAR